MYDLVIVGAVPAGVTLARLLGKKYIVLKLLKVPFMYDPVLRKAIMSIGLRNIDLINEDNWGPRVRGK